MTSAAELVLMSQKKVECALTLLLTTTGVIEQFGRCPIFEFAFSNPALCCLAFYHCGPLLRPLLIGLIQVR